MFDSFTKNAKLIPSVLGQKKPRTSTFSQNLNDQLSGFSFGGSVKSITDSVTNAATNAFSNPIDTIKKVANGNVSGAINSIFRSGGSNAAIISGSSTSAVPVLPGGDSPQWGSLNPAFIANIFMLTDGVADESELVVKGAATEVEIDFQMNWQSPFEGAGAESKAPALMALIQSGQIGIITQSLQAIMPNGDSQGGVIDSSLAEVSSVLGQAAQKTKDFAKSLEGRTGITKLNSRQVFSGMPPISISLVLHLRAFKDPIAEVVEPYQKLLEWSLPQQLAADGIIANTANAVGDDQSIINALFPSKAPVFIGFRYANNLYSPMVIESVGHPLDGPADDRGLPLYRAIRIKISTLTALDRADIKKAILR